MISRYTIHIVAPQSNIRFLTRMRDARLKRLASLRPFLSASLVKIARVCGNPRCRCAAGHKHRSYYLTFKQRAKTRTLYVPVDLVDEVKQWVGEYRRIKLVMSEVSELQKQIIKRHVTERRAQGNVRKNSRRSS